jgi:hypothetical protein
VFFSSERNKLDAAATCCDYFDPNSKQIASTICQGRQTMILRCSYSIALLVFALIAGCKSPYHADKGAAAGGLAGAAVGAAIGEHNDNPLAGALIGGAVGMITGNAIGESIDEDIARNNAIIEERMGRRLAGAAQLEDVVAMTQAGLGDPVIVTHIQSHGVVQPPTAQDMIFLKQQGVSDIVINALQNQPPITAEPVGPPVRPVIVEEHHYVRPAYFGPPPRHYRHHRHYHPSHRKGVHWGLSFGN